MFGVCDGVTNNVLQENLQNATGLLVDQTRDSLDTSTASQTANSGFSNSLDVLFQVLAMALGTSLAQALASFTIEKCRTKNLYTYMF
jgi:hypothetical protein